MKHLLTYNLSQEVAQAMLRGDVNYAETLQNMDLVRTLDSDSMDNRVNAANNAQFVDEDY